MLCDVKLCRILSNALDFVFIFVLHCSVFKVHVTVSDILSDKKESYKKILGGE